MRALPVLLSLVFTACANDLRADFPFDGETTTGPLVSAEQNGAVTRLSIDATNKQSQVYVDLDDAKELKPDEAFATNEWDLAFKRFDVFMNSGASGPTGTVEGQVLDGADWDSLTTAPADGYVVDPPDRLFNAVAEGWYRYDIGVHRLFVRDNLIYVVRTTKGTYLKLRMLNYYDAAGTPAVISLEYAPLTAP